MNTYGGAPNLTSKIQKGFMGDLWHSATIWLDVRNETVGNHVTLH